MKNLLIICFLLIHYFSFTQTINVGLSTRPTYYFNNGNNIERNNNKSILNKSISKKINIILSIEFENNKKFFHTPIFGFSTFSNISLVQYKTNDTLTNEIATNKLINIYQFGYGVGKKSKLIGNYLFLNIRSSLISNIKHHLYSNQNSNFYTNNIKEILFEYTEEKPFEYSFFIELKPSLEYRYKAFSLSVGFPLNLQYTFSKGLKKTNSKISYLTALNTKETSNVSDVNYSYFRFNYDLELTLRYYFKRKLCITKPKKQ